jgi:hypothetical protein
MPESGIQAHRAATLVQGPVAVVRGAWGWEPLSLCAADEVRHHSGGAGMSACVTATDREAREPPPVSGRSCNAGSWAKQ